MLLRGKNKTRSLSMMFVPHYDSPVRVVRLPFSLIYALVVVVIVGGVMLGQTVYRYGQMQSSIETLRQGSNRRLVDLQREMLNDYSIRVNKVENKMAVIDEYLSYLKNLKTEVGKSVGVMGDSNLEAIRAANDLEPTNPKPASEYVPTVFDSLEKTGDRIIKESAERSRSLSIINTYAQEYKDIKERTPTGFPVKGRLTSTFGWRAWSNSFHEGVDLIVPTGTPVHATASGQVVRSEWYSGYGLVVDILHRDGIVTRYGHNDKNLVQKGEYVRADQVIALSGSTGNSDVPHVHYEIRINDRAVDPQKFPF